MKKTTFVKRIIYFFRPFWKYLIVMVSLIFVAQLLGTVSPFLFGKSVDAVTNKNAQGAFYFLLLSFVLSIIQSIVLLHWRERVEVLHLDDYIEQEFSEVSLKKVLSFSVGQHHNEHSGVKQSVVNKGQSSLINFTQQMIYLVVPNVLQVLITLVVLAIFDWRTAIIAAFFVFWYVVVSLRRNKKVFPKIEALRTKRQKQQKLQSELYRNATLVISEGQQDKTAKEFNYAYSNVNAFMERLWLDYLKVFYTHKMLIIVGQYATLAFGVYLIVIGQHSAGMFVVLFSWTGSIFGNLQQVMNAQRQMLFQIVEIKKYFSLLDITPDIDHTKKGIILPDLKGAITFSDVNFAYPYRTSTQDAEKEDVVSDEEKTEDHVVTDITFSIKAGAKIGFVGMSGSGKSTIINLIRRYYDPTSGDISIDGVPLKDIDLQWLRSQIGNVDQKIDLFDRSVRDNILFGLTDGETATNEMVQHVVQQASLGDFIAKLKEHGLDTVIGEGGIKVSGGERQRIGIARALIKNPKILIFDEATSALDSINEKLIHDAINESAKGRTTIIIAHRLSTVMDADAIYVVADGKVVDHGTHAVLEKRCAEYQALIKNQMLL